jgi:hypothetical protein
MDCMNCLRATLLGVRKLACALSWLAQTKPCPIFSSTACRGHYGNSAHSVARKGLSLVPSLEQRTMSLNSDPFIEMRLRAKPAQVFRCVTGCWGVE